MRLHACTEIRLLEFHAPSLGRAFSVQRASLPANSFLPPGSQSCTTANGVLSSPAQHLVRWENLRCRVLFGLEN